MSTLTSTIARNSLKAARTSAHFSAVFGRKFYRFTKPKVQKFLQEAFFLGPKQLLTSRISHKCAAIMSILCVPSLVIFTLLMGTKALFRTPEQQAYFHFAQILNDDPLVWLTLLLAGACSILALAIPAVLPGPVTGFRH